MDIKLKIPFFSVVFNLVFSLYYIIWGMLNHSWWMFTIGIYYLILCIVRYIVLRNKRTDSGALFAGIMLMVLTLPLFGTIILSFIKDRGTVFHLIVMLIIAIYSFTKITLAAIHWIKSRRIMSKRWMALRNISFADAFVSIFSLQRSMLVSFEGMTDIEIKIMNLATGVSVCIIVFFLGLDLVRRVNKSSNK